MSKGYSGLFSGTKGAMLAVPGEAAVESYVLTAQGAKDYTYFQNIARRADVDANGIYDVVAHGASNRIQIEHNGINMYICEKCGAEMKPLSELYPIGMTCPNCGWGWATTYIDPINLDENDYRMILVSSENSLSNIKLVSETANCNYVEAKKLIEKAPVEIFCGKAVEVKTIKEKLEAANIEIRIEPEFPY